jgi:iron complex outermembrane recepter protein
MKLGCSRLRLSFLVSTAALALLAAPEARSEEEIIVTGSRLPRDLSSVPGSVTVISLQDLSTQRTITDDLGQILGATVPGFGANSQGASSNFDQTLRGRKPAVLIDGIPTTVPLRDGGRDVRVIGVAALQRVEVIRGSTAIYGLGGAGGLINYVTKLPGEGAPEFETKVGTGVSLTHVGDSATWNIDQSASGRVGRFSFVGDANFEKINGLYDADGDRIPPDPNLQGGIAYTQTANIFAKFGIDLDDKQRIQVAVNWYDQTQDANFHIGPGVFGVTKSVAIPGRDPREKNQYVSNLLTYARYANEDLLGSSVALQAYYADYSSRFSYFPPPSFITGGQSVLESEKKGLRLDISTPLPVFANARVLWGIDVSGDRTVQPLVDGRIYVPVMDQTSYAPFAQLEFDATTWLKIRGGVRYESVDLDVPSFTTVPYTPGTPSNAVQGGTLSYSQTVGNIGAVVNFTDQVSGFAAFSQGFSVADIGRILRATTVKSVAAFKAEAQVINSYEVGLRVDFGRVRGTFALYQSTSDLGSTFNPLTLDLVRSKEKVWGAEATLDAELSDTVRAGGTYSRSDGKRDSRGTGALDLHLDTTRINPDKLTGYVEWRPLPGWLLRLQGLHSFAQNRFPQDTVPAFGRTRVAAYTLFDLAAEIPLGPGQLGIGVQNLLNEDYFTPASYRWAQGSTFAKGPGATATVSYKMRW